MSYKIIWEQEGLRCIFKKDFTTNDQLESNIEISKDSRFPSIRYAIYDFTDVKTYSIESSVYRDIGHMDSKLYKINPDIKLAVVANKMVIKGMLNVYKTYFELENNDKTWEIEMFETVTEAEKWIFT